MSGDYTDEILEETPMRVTRLLTGLARSSVIRTHLHRGGMLDVDVTEGRDLLFRCLAPPPSSASGDTADARRRRDAIAALDAWDEPNFARYRAALRRHHRPSGEYIFDGLSAATGAAAVQSVATFLQRLDAVEAGRAAGISRTDGRKAALLLAARGLTDAERGRLRGLVDDALGPAEALPAPDTSAHDARREALSALRAWFDEWSAVARAEVTRRDHLILLGLVARRRPKKPAPEPIPTA
ncbi:MAG: hypothetical protein R3A48_19965 [Polyangiales bacterium]